MSSNSNIKVAIRVRPLISREKCDKLKEQWEVNENSIYPIDVTTGKRNGEIYHFDHIFDSTCCNADIYNTVVHPVVDKAVNGFNGTIFAYGQTSSGKTFTMMGNSKEDGIISKAVESIFLGIEQSVNRKFLLRVSYLEIYNEKLYDLLDVKNIVKIGEDFNGSVRVNVKEEVTDCAEKVYNIMKKGDKARRIGETNMNEKSSRSHTIFRIIIESSDITDEGVVNVAHLNLVDLAGSERATLTKATGQRLKEGAHINKSLSTLSLVMKQLSDSQDFINFRDSKLTRILQPSLGGNALTAIICAITPAALEETHSTLAFASRAKTVKNKPFLNEIVTDEALINRYAQEINKLKSDLQVANNKRSLQAEKIAVLQKCILMPKKTKTINTIRRKTWCAPHDSNKMLPIIYETDVLRLSDHSNCDDKINTITNLQNPQTERCSSVDDYYSETDNSKFPEKKQLPSFTILPCQEDIILPELLQTSEINQTPTKMSEEVVKWLVSSTDTPKSVHKERAEYYEREFNSLKEITTKEKLLLTVENTSEMNILKLELDHIKNELECERKMKKEAKIDYEFLAEMYKEKYKKREKELLDSLKEARDMLKSNNNTDDEKTLEIFPDFSLVNEFLEKCKHHLNFLKTELASNLSVSTVQKLFDEIKKLNEDMLINSASCTEEIQEFLNVFNFMFDLASIVLCDDTLIFEVIKEKQKLENRVSYFENKEKTYEVLVSKKDEEIRHLSDNILQYMNELVFYKTEVTKYKEMAINHSIYDTKNITDLKISTHNNDNQIPETDLNIQTEENYPAIIRSKDKEIEDLSGKIMEYIEELTSLEQEFNKLKSVFETNQTDLISKYEADIDAKHKLLSEKNNFIKELKNKIKNLQSEVKILKVQIENEKTLFTGRRTSMTDKHFRVTQEIIENKDSENTVKNSDLIMKTNQYIQTEEHFPILKDLFHDKNKDIKELSTNIVDYKNNVSIEEEVHKYIPDLKIHEDLMESNNKVIEKLSSNVNCENEEVEEFSLNAVCHENNISSNEEVINKYKSDLKIHENLILSKNKEIEELSSNVVDYKNKLSLTEKEVNKYKSDLNISKDLIKSKNKEIAELSSNVVDFKNKLSLTEKEVNKYKSDLNISKDLIKSKNKEIAELSSNVVDFKNKLSLTEKEVNKYKSDLNISKDLIKSKNKEIAELSSNVVDFKNKLSLTEKEVNKYKSDLNIFKDLIKSKNKEIEELSSNVVAYKNNLSSTEEEVNKYKSVLKIHDDHIEEFLSNIVDYINNLSSTEKEFFKYQEQKDTIHSSNSQILKLCDNTSKLLLLKDNKLDNLKHYLEIIQNIINLKNNKIESITELLDELRKKKNEEINALQIKLSTKEERIVFMQTDIENLNEIVNQRTKDLQKLNEKKIIVKTNNSSQTESLEDLKQYLLKSEIETWNNKLIFEETKIVQYLKKIKDLEEAAQNAAIKNDNLVEDMTKLKKKNEDYKKIVEKVTDRANSKITCYNDVVVKLKKDNELLKIQLNNEKKLNQTLQSSQVVLRGELEKKKSELNSGDDFITLHTKITHLEMHNKQMVRVIEDYQEQMYAKDCECNNLKITITALKNENASLQNITKDLNSKIRDAEGALEDVKFELYSLKNKEREKNIKIKRRSTHDSSRSLSSDEHAVVIDENQQTHHQSCDNNKSADSKSHETEKKERLPLADKQFNEHDERLPKLEIENEKLRKKNEQLIHLCRLRKQRIDELMRKIE